jgi:hypothetical protein
MVLNLKKEITREEINKCHLATNYSNTNKRIQNIVLVEKPMLKNRG